jgi:OFA family oxalate/formate antiporter-like MFS transporter
MSSEVKRWLVLPAGLVMLLCLGTAQAWSVYVEPLQRQYGLSSFETQLVFTTATMVFCLFMIVAGRWQDRLGPRPLALAGALLVGASYAITYLAGGRYFFLWLGMGVVYGLGCATAYTCPIATAVKWFPRHRGLVAGLSAAAFGAGPIVVQAIAQRLLDRHWPVLSVMGFIGTIYTPLLVLTALAMATPPGDRHASEVDSFRRRSLLPDRRFWILFFGMLCGTFPYLLVMGNAKLIAEAWQVSAAVGLAIPVLAVGNSAGRIFWGYTLDRFGCAPAMRGAQILLILCTAALLAVRGSEAVFLIAAMGIGFCYGSNFAIYPGTIARVYGPHLLGSIYPLVMAAQAISSIGPSIGGHLRDLTGSFQPGVVLSLCVAAGGLILTAILGWGARKRNWNF